MSQVWSKRRRSAMDRATAAALSIDCRRLYRWADGSITVLVEPWQNESDTTRNHKGASTGVYNTVAGGSIFIFVQPFLAPKSAQSRNYAKVPENSNLAVHGNPRSSILVPIQSAYATSYLIVTLDYLYRFREIDAFISKIDCFRTIVWRQWRNALRYQRNLYTAEKYI